MTQTNIQQQREQIVYNYLISNGINKEVAKTKSKEFYFKSECDEFIQNKTAYDLINESEYTQEDQTDLNITRCLRELRK